MLKYKNLKKNNNNKFKKYKKYIKDKNIIKKPEIGKYKIKNSK